MLPICAIILLVSDLKKKNSSCGAYRIIEFVSRSGCAHAECTAKSVPVSWAPSRKKSIHFVCFP